MERKNPMKQKDPKPHKQASLILDLSFTTHYTEKLKYIKKKKKSCEYILEFLLHACWKKNWSDTIQSTYE